MIKQTKKEIKTKLKEKLKNLNICKNDVCGGYDFKNTDLLVNEAYNLEIIEAEDCTIATKHFFDINETIILDYNIKVKHIEDFDALIDLVERLLDKSQAIADKLKITK